MISLRRFGFAGALTLFPAAAWAHPMAGVGDFYAGMLHPITSIECLLPLVALGLLAGRQPRPVAILMWIGVPIGTVLGAAIGVVRPLPAYAGVIEIAFMAVLGIAISSALTLPLWVAGPLATVPAMAIGWMNSVESSGVGSTFKFLAGVVLAGFVLTTYGIGSVRRLPVPWMVVGVRVVGSWIAAIGVLLLGLK
jgi:urease accessory protein